MGQKTAMIAALTREISMTPSGQQKADTLYFGGGTPSILNIDEIQQIIEAVQKQFGFTEGMEITLEANPDDISAAKLQQWKAAGVNRFSVGIQSFLDEELKWMNRAHTAAESLHCIDAIREAGFDNFSVDLIYGSPLLSDDDWKRNMDTVIKKDIPHISCYALTVEPKTALDKMIALHTKEPVDPEKQSRQFLLLMDRMQQAGYEHYEISNFAKPGLRSKHNSSYWMGKQYFGFGPSAHSFDGKSRRWNIANNTLYIQSLEKGILPFEEELLTSTEQLNEYIMISLRTMEGLSLLHVRSLYGSETTEKLLQASGKWTASGKLRIEKDRMILTKEGKLFADGIAADLFF